MSPSSAGSRILAPLRWGVRPWVVLPAGCIALFFVWWSHRKPAPPVTIPSAFVGRPGGVRVFFSPNGR